MIMEGKEVFRRAVRAVVESAGTALERAKLTTDDIALFVPHQANVRIIEAVCSRLGIPTERVVVVIDRTGNTSSASIPLALVDGGGRGPHRRRRPRPALRLRRRHDLGLGGLAMGKVTVGLPGRSRPVYISATN